MSSQKIKFGDKEVIKKNSIHLKKLFFLDSIDLSIMRNITKYGT